MWYRRIKAKHILLLVGIIFLLAVAGGWFYWFQYRPSLIRADCHNEAGEKAQDLLKTKAELDPYDAELKKAAEKGLHLRDDYESYFRNCLNSRGLAR